jgi:hypothetical protein
MTWRFRSGLFLLACALTACRGKDAPAPSSAMATEHHTANFGDDLTFLGQHTKVVVLSEAHGAQVAVAPAYQGRVMTSSASGPSGASLGYLHRAGIEAGTPQPHMTVLGGEDRFWLGPEGGQYALYFPPGAAFDTDHWQVPQPIDWDSWPVVRQNQQEVSFQRAIEVTNYSGTRFSLRVDRDVRLLDASAVARDFGQDVGPGTHVVVYETDNRITNTGGTTWTKDKGLVSIWILGMYRPGPKTTVVVPFVPGSEAERGPIVNDKYFGAIGADRLHIGEAALFLRADGQKRGKIGLPRARARGVAGSYDPDAHVLTIVKFTVPSDATDYVNSMWERQDHPYAGDVVNSYNDGPLTPGGAPLGPFYEIESSSPAAALAPNASLRHVHRTFHLEGPENELDAVARAALGVSLEEISSTFK